MEKYENQMTPENLETLLEKYHNSSEKDKDDVLKIIVHELHNIINDYYVDYSALLGHYKAYNKFIEKINRELNTVFMKF